jgi:hypothetical protein
MGQTRLADVSDDPIRRHDLVKPIVTVFGTDKDDHELTWSEPSDQSNGMLVPPRRRWALFRDDLD